MSTIISLRIWHGHGVAIEQGDEFMAHQAGFRPTSPNQSNSALLGIGFNSTEMLARDSQQDA